MRGWQANKRRTLCVACNFRALPETEIPRAEDTMRFKRFSALLVVTFVKAFFPEDLLALVIAFEDGLGMLVLPKRKPNEKARKNGTKGITCRIPLELHNRISGKSGMEAPCANSSNDYPRAL
ncbi:MAG: hypothetical protein ACLUIO_20850 [Neglectibacter timonensis]